MKKILSILMIITMLVLTVTGCGGDKTQTNNNQQTGNNANQVTEGTNNNENTTSSDVGGQTNEFSETRILEEIQLSDQRSGQVWKYDMGTDGSKIVISAGYTVDTDYVYDITFSVEINKSNSAYEESKIDLKKYESQLEALNDDEITVNFRETDNGIEFFADFNGLEYANREKRIEMAEEVIGITANDTDATFRFSELDSELKAIGFVYGA